MSDPGKAVFLSYASQDAEAARRICEALRAAGVEVWFDQSELVGGDAWDTKIRGQIASCALFLPVISAGTQARGEGYFRLEWKLAVDRSHLMAHDQPFLLPIVIDATGDAVARVPPEFKQVQWTRLANGEAPERFCARVKALLGGEGRNAAPKRPSPDSPESHGRLGETSLPAKTSRSWLIPATLAAAAVITFALWQPWKRSSLARSLRASSAPAATTPTETTELLGNARKLFETPDATADDCALAEDYCKQALKLAPDDANVWAVYSELSSRTYGYGYDQTAARLELARTQAERALKLAPRSTEARFAKATQLRFMGEAFLGDAEKLLRELSVETPEDPRVWITLGKVIWRANTGMNGIRKDLSRANDALDAFAHAAAIPAGRAEGLCERGTLLYQLGRFDEAEAATDESVQLAPVIRAVGNKAGLAIRRGDFAAAQAAVARLSPEAQQSDDGILTAAWVWLHSGNADRCLDVLNTFPRDFLSGNPYRTPTDSMRGYAYALAGKTAAARSARQSALQVVERRLEAEPRDPALLLEHADLLGLLGERDRAVTALKLYDEVQPGPYFSDPWELWVIAAHANVEPPDRTIDRLEVLFKDQHTAMLESSYFFPMLRGNPRFDALLAKLAPVPKPKATSDTTPAPDLSAVALAKADAKSVAVLPFANLSGDPGQEYFSDGLTEEILTALSNERDLHVPGRTSVFSFKGKTLTTPEIARALNVAQVVEGSVRKAGNEVRITVSLTRASDGFSEPLGTFTEKLDDIFALQEKVARAVVEKITKRTTTASGVAVQTKSPAAYDAYLRARARQVNVAAGVAALETIRLYDEVTRLDPNYALPWARISQVYEFAYASGFDRSVEIRTKAANAATTALRLAPDLPEAHFATAMIRLTVDRDLDAAQKELNEAERLRPNDPEAPWIQARIDYARGRWDEGFCRLVLRAAELDPQNAANLMSAATLLSSIGRFADADRLFGQSLAVSPNPGAIVARATNYLGWTGDVNGVMAMFESFPEADVRGYLPFYNSRGIARTLHGDITAAMADFEKVRAEVAAGKFTTSGARGQRVRSTYLLARLEKRQGHDARAAALLGEALPEARQLLQEFPDAVGMANSLAYVQAALGQKNEALATADQAVRIVMETGIAAELVNAHRGKAELLTLLGETDAAVAELRAAHELGHGFGYRLRRELEWEPLRDDPKFQQLMKEAEARADAQPRPKP